MEEIKLPVHISGLWKPVYAENPLETGSLGIGLVLRPLTRILIRDARENCDVMINDTCVKMVHVETAKRIYGFSSSLRIYQKIPLGAGAGVSANISIGLGYSVARVFFEDPVKRLILAGLIGHELEVLHRTGLGDVITELMGSGIEIRRRPGPPCRGSVENIKTSGKIIFSVILYPRTMFTPDMLKSYSREAEESFNKLYHGFVEEPSIENFFEVSKAFSERIGFLTKELDESLRILLKKYISSGDVIGYFAKKALIIIAHNKDLGIDPLEIRRIFKTEEIITMEFLEEPILQSVDRDICNEVVSEYIAARKQDLVSSASQ